MIKVMAWVCDECGYVRLEKSAGVHQTWNRDDPRGRMVMHELRPALLGEVEEATVEDIKVIQRAGK